MERFEPIAIVGVGMRAAGGIDSLLSLWDTVIHHKSHHGCLATDPRFLRRFDPEDFHALFSAIPEAKTTLHVNLLDETPGLDEAYFGVNKRDSACMDVQLKLLLHIAHEALEDAGFSGAADGSAFDPSSFGVYVAASTDDFQKDPKCYAMDIYHLVGTQRAFLAGQISHKFGLHGPAVSVDTVCAGAITAFNDACRALANGECSAAIAGGVHVMSPLSAPSATMSLKLSGFLDPAGQCKPFLADGAGYCRAEGCGLAVLKRLSDAIRDGDRIHGVIQGMGVGNMASSRSIVRPDGELQSLTLAKAVSSSGIDPVDISFIEAHGPGTQQGDPAELLSICSAIAKHRKREQETPLLIGSIKSNVGHAEAASGAISLFKVLAMMRYKRIPPQANFHVSKLNPRLKPFFDNYSLRVSDSDRAWSAERRIAVVSNFGASGYAGHMVVVEPPSSSRPLVGSPWVNVSPLPFVISAKDASTLVVIARTYADWLDGYGASIPLADISYSTTARRILHPHFMVLQAQSHAELARKLCSDVLTIINASSQRPRTLAFCFSGQGGPRVDPRTCSLYQVSTAFTSAVDTCFQLSETEKLVGPEDVEALELFALQVGLAEMWRTWGVTPVALAGHSFGEYVALVRAGVLSLHDALMLVGIRARLVREKCTVIPSKMAALRLALAQVYGLLERQQTTRVELACINSEESVTLAGTFEDLNVFREEVLKAHPAARWQLVDNMKAAFHSRFVEPLHDEFLEACKDITFRTPRVTVLSGPLGTTLVPEDEEVLQPDYLLRHCLETNKFGKAILDFKARNDAAGACQPDWIELGPHCSTIGFIPLAPGQLKLPSHYKGASGYTTTLNTLVALRSVGHAINFIAFHRDINPTARHIDLPRYPFRMQPHIYPVRRDTHVSSGYAENRLYSRLKSEEIASILKGHLVANQPICPASVYMALVLSASFERRKERQAFRLSRFTMTAPFTKLSEDWLQARATFSSSKVAPSAFDVISKSGKVHASMQIEVYDESVLLGTLGLLKPLVMSLGSIKTMSGTNILSTRLVYDLFSKTVEYADHCQGLRRVWISEDSRQAWALSSNDPEEVAHRDELEPPALRDFSPILMDRACQLVGLLINTSPARAQDEIFVASEIDQVEIAWSMVQESRTFESFASFDVVGSEKGDAMAVGQVLTFDGEGRLVAAFRGVKMRRLKRRIVEHIVRASAGATGQSEIPKPPPPPVRLQAPFTPMMTPKKQDTTQSMNDQMQRRVSEIVQSKLGGDNIHVDRKLAELGLDSLAAVEITVELGRLIPEHKLPGDLLARQDTTLAVLFDALQLSSVNQGGETFDTSAVVNKLVASAPNRVGTGHDGPYGDSSTKGTMMMEGLPGTSPATSMLTPTVEDENESLHDQMRRKVSGIVQSKLRGDSIPVDRKLSELGLDSLAAVEITVELGRLMPEQKIPGDLISRQDTTLAVLFDALHLSSINRPTVTLDANGIARKSSVSTANREGINETYGEDPTPPCTEGAMTVLDNIGINPELIQDKPGSLPLMLIHDGGGTALAYRLLGDVGHTVLGVHNPGLRDGKSIVSIRHAADEYAALARQWLNEARNPDNGEPRRIVVGGWSLGGIIALSLASLHPDLVSGVILLDPPPPGTKAMTSAEAAHLIPSAAPRSSSGFGSLVRTQLIMNGRALSADTDHQDGYRAFTACLETPVYLISAEEPLTHPLITMTGDGGETNNPVTASPPGSCTAWMLSRDRAGVAEAAWKQSLGKKLVGSKRLPGDHFTMFTPVHAASTTHAVRKALDFLSLKVD